jgi:hypothetical protein
MRRLPSTCGGRDPNRAGITLQGRSSNSCGQKNTLSNRRMQIIASSGEGAAVRREEVETGPSPSGDRNYRASQ